MQQLMIAILISVATIGAQAETRTIQMWTCAINDGKTAADVQAMNTKWLKFVNSKVKGGGVRSFALTPVTGNLEEFVFIDSYPNDGAWAQQRAAITSPEGVALEAEFNTVSTCTSSSLFSSTES